jgi:hypothetical protein
MSWPVALAAVGLAVVLSFPLAYLFELGGRTIWAPAILHFRRAGRHQGRRAARRGRRCPADHVDGGVRRRPLAGLGLAPADGVPRVTDRRPARRALASRRCPAMSAGRRGSR